MATTMQERAPGPVAPVCAHEQFTEWRRTSGSPLEDHVTVVGECHDCHEYLSITIYADGREDATVLGQGRSDAEWERYDRHGDFTPWCVRCGAMRRADCDCGPLAEND